MTILEGLNLPDRQFAVFCRSNFSMSSEGCCPPHRVLLHLHFVALPHHDGGGAQRILEELHHRVPPVLPQALPQRGAQQAPEQEVQEACQLHLQGILNNLLSHFTICNVISKSNCISNHYTPIHQFTFLTDRSTHWCITWGNGLRGLAAPSGGPLESTWRLCTNSC